MKNRYAVIILGAVAMIMIAMMVLMFVRINRMEERYLRLLSESRQAAAGPGGASSDPYLRGPVKNTVMKHRNEILACYAGYLGRIKAGTDAKAVREGSVTLDWQVDDEGEALSPGLVRSDFTDKSFHECLAKAVGGWRFPEPPYGEKKYVEHTFQFRDEKKN